MPLRATLGLAALQGLRRAGEPITWWPPLRWWPRDGGDTRGAMRLGVWWGVGHAFALLAIGLPLILFKANCLAG